MVSSIKDVHPVTVMLVELMTLLPVKMWLRTPQMVFGGMLPTHKYD